MTARESSSNYRQQVANAMDEDTWQQLVISEAKVRRWSLIYHTHDSRRSSAGFPDLVLCRPPRLIFVELKTVRGKLTSEQHAWMAALASCGTVEAYIWRPDDTSYRKVLR